MNHTYLENIIGHLFGYNFYICSVANDERARSSLEIEMPISENQIGFIWECRSSWNNELSPTICFFFFSNKEFKRRKMGQLINCACVSIFYSSPRMKFSFLCRLLHSFPLEGYFSSTSSCHLLALICSQLFFSSIYELMNTDAIRRVNCESDVSTAFTTFKRFVML